MSRKPTLADFETHDLLEAVDDLDSIRGILANGPHLEPPQIRIDLLKLHELAMQVCNQGEDAASELFELAIDLEYRLEEIQESAERVLTVLRGLTEADFDDEDQVAS